MEKTDIQKHVLEYAHNKLSPFTAAIAFDNIDTIDTPKQVSDALGRLYNQRVLARRKVDKIRYEYIRAEIRPVGFEMAPEQPAAEPKTTEQTTIKSEAKPTENEQNHEDHNLTEELRAQRTQAAVDCTLTDDELIIKAHQWISTLCDSGGKAWILKIPVNHNNDPDMIFYELVKRFSESRLSKINAESIVESIQEQKQPEKQKHSHYFVDVSRYNTIDIYRITELYKCSQMAAHITKKALCSGSRGHKDLTTDIKEIIDTANRWLEMIAEDGEAIK